ncbi:thermostable neutral protease NprT precursor [Saccharicrinis fermentans DSM 9555 = JCM 21142]|uniref:Thermostable neutral protease NprT n=2 Tax=Saccharicrinis fermentans TaxID=982 RepID=W7YPL3_9BACT|nr:thermostable neutral protease NprT precursor [Saccharicrinis fermentans DSM 9555 = JCM 21142]
MTYGDGNSSSKNAFTSLDIVGHEIAHGLTSYSANLEYRDESGALNESFSDIFGIAIDFYVYPSTANYLMGEQIFTDGVSFLRNISDPKAGYHPDTYKGTYWHTGSADYGGVHKNSTVQSYWFYLLCEGGSGVNDNGSSYIVKSIGLEAAEAIAYRNLTVYLNRYSKFEDARFYSIQSAIDLYGDCSNEVIQVTNAWYAVGVGSAYENAVVSSFYADQTLYCSVPAQVQLINSSTHAESYKWYLNDELFSTEQNPMLSINELGVFDVKLEVTGTAECNSTDVTTLEDYITVVNQATPMAAVHVPATLNNGTGGIYGVGLNDLNHRSQGASQGYEDFTCGYQTVLMEGKSYSVSVTTGEDQQEVVGIWLDINNDGVFSNAEEKIFSSKAFEDHSGDVKIPAGVVFDTPIRLRVGSDRYDYASNLDGSNDSHYGQYEDYTVVLERNTAAPLSLFLTKDTSVFVNQEITFYDKSDNLVKERSWHFEGGVPEYSNDPNPTVTYSDDGVFDVELTVSNEYGTSYSVNSMRVVNDYLMGVHDHSNLASGHIYDEGGFYGAYENGREQTFLIAPYCAKEIVFTLDWLSTESCCDVLNVYDGTNENGVLLASLNGDVFDPVVLKASSGSMFLRFISNETVTGKGFVASWETVAYSGGNSVDASFEIAEERWPVNYNLQFEDHSSYGPKLWSWDFGDGTTSAMQNPQHIFHTAGVYEVQLAVDNCISKDTLKKQVKIEAAPELLLTNDTIRLDVLSGEMIDSFIPVRNLNEGLLAYEGKLLDAYEKGNSQNPVRYYSFEPRLDGIRIGLAKNVFYYNALKNSLTDYGAVCLSVSSGDVTRLLTTLDVLVIDDSADFLDDYKNEIREWVNKGGFLIIQGDGRIDDFNGLLEGWGIEYVSKKAEAGSAHIINHAINGSLDAYVIGAHADCTLSLYSPALSLLTDANDNCYAAITGSGKGKILAMGDESFSSITVQGHQQFLFSALEYCVTPLNTALCELKPGFVFMYGENTDSLRYKIDSNGLVEGQYVVDIQVLSNDDNASTVNIPLLLNVAGVEHIESDVNTLSFGEVLLNEQAVSVFKIRNSGSGNLMVNSLISSNSAFLTDFSPLEIKPGEVVSFEVRFTPTQLIEYSGTIELHSSDPNVPMLSISLQGDTYSPPEVSNPVADRIVYVNYDEDMELNHIFSDADGDVLTFEVLSSDPSVVEPVIYQESLLQLNPLKVGNVDITIEARDVHQAMVSHTFHIQVKQNQSPTCPVSLADVHLDMNDPVVDIDLNDHFMDADGDVLSYSGLLSADGIVAHDLDGGLLTLTPIGPGSVQLDVTAADGHGGETMTTLNVYVGVSTQLGESISDNAIRLYPNPVSSVLYVDMKLSDPLIRVFDTKGNRLDLAINIHLNKAQIYLSHLESGVYIVKIISSDTEYVHKIVKH